jgi:hypothetical protein
MQVFHGLAICRKWHDALLVALLLLLFVKFVHVLHLGLEFLVCLSEGEQCAGAQGRRVMDDNSGWIIIGPIILLFIFTKPFGAG